MPVKKWFLFSVSPIFLLGCSSFDDEQNPFVQEEPERILRLASVGEEAPAPDPNSLDIMRQAVDSVARNSRGRSRAVQIVGAQIEPTYRYVCFHPATDSQWDALLGQQDFISSGIFPLDQVSPVSEGENCYTPVEGKTFDRFYAVMPATVELPDTIACEVLMELYDPASAEEGEADPAWAQRVMAQARVLVDDEGIRAIFPGNPPGSCKSGMTFSDGTCRWKGWM